MSREDEQARKDRNARMWEAKIARAKAWKAAHREDAPRVVEAETCSHCSYCQPRKGWHCHKCCPEYEPPF